jgi:hypothetical protein
MSMLGQLKLRSGSVSELPKPLQSGEQGPPGRRKRSDVGRPRGPRAPKYDYEALLGGWLFAANSVIRLTPLRDDALDLLELSALARQLAEEVKRNAQLRRYIDAVASTTAGGMLVGVILGIGARRMARRNFIIPAELDPVIVELAIKPAAGKPSMGFGGILGDLMAPPSGDESEPTPLPVEPTPLRPAQKWRDVSPPVEPAQPDPYTPRAVPRPAVSDVSVPPAQAIGYAGVAEQAPAE